MSYSSFFAFQILITVTYECKNPYGMMGMSANDWLVTVLASQERMRVFPAISSLR